MAKSWKVLALLNIAMVAADVEIYPKSEPMMIVADFLDAEANFGYEIPIKGISAMVVLAEPENGCTKLQPPPNVSNPTPYWAVLIKRYNCSFEDKVFNAQEAFYDVAIIHNVESNKLEIMNASNPDRIHISAIFITGNAGKEIKTKYLYDKGYAVRIEPNSNGDLLGKILIPFVVIISASFVIMIGIMIMKCIKDQRRARRRRLPNSSLNKIPTAKFRKNDPFETCAICLDDFVEGEKLRILPCSHAYHCKCIDPWLTRNRRVCPMCKRKVFAADERAETDDSSSEDDDHTPLIRGSGPATYGGTQTTRDPIVDLIRDRDPDIADIMQNFISAHRQRVLSDPFFRSQLSEGQRQRGCGSQSDSYSSASSGDLESDDSYNPFNNSASSQPVVIETIVVQVGSSQDTTTDPATDTVSNPATDTVRNPSTGPADC